MKTNRLLVISFDAMGGMDESFIRTLPNFGRFLEEACICSGVKSVYPSITYPAHTSIITGRYPKHHGVIHNTLLMPKEESPDWYWQRSYIKGTTLYDEAVKKGMKVAAFLWPVTARAKIQYNVPEIFANRPWSNQIMTSLFNGTPVFQAVLNKKFGHLRCGKRQPDLDNFVQASLLYTLREHMPDLTLVHFTDLDSHRHLFGVESDEAYEAMRRHDRRLGEIIAELKRLDIYKDTNIILLGDHYQKDVSKVIYLNHLFKERGYLEVKDNKIVNWKVICKNCDGCAYIYLRKGWGHLAGEVYALLNELKMQESGIETVYNHRQAVAKGADPRCAMMVEAKDGYYFLDQWRTFSENVQVDTSQSDFSYLKAAHGYDPDKEDYATIFMASGPGFKKGVRLQKMQLVDEGVTMAALLDLDLGRTDGRLLKEILA